MRKRPIFRSVAYNMIKTRLKEFYTSLAGRGIYFEPTPESDGDEGLEKIFERMLRRKYRIID